MPFSSAIRDAGTRAIVERPRVREARLAVQDDEPAGPDGAQDLGRRRRGRDDDEHVALLHLVAAVDGRRLVPAQERRDRRPAPLGLELGEALHPEPGARERVGEDLRREHDPFAAAADEQHLLHGPEWSRHGPAGASGRMPRAVRSPARLPSAASRSGRRGRAVRRTRAAGAPAAAAASGRVGRSPQALHVSRGAQTRSTVPSSRRARSIPGRTPIARSPGTPRRSDRRGRTRPPGGEHRLLRVLLEPKRVGRARDGARAAQRAALGVDGRTPSGDASPSIISVEPVQVPDRVDGRERLRQPYAPGQRRDVRRRPRAARTPPPPPPRAQHGPPHGYTARRRRAPAAGGSTRASERERRQLHERPARRCVAAAAAHAKTTPLTPGTSSRAAPRSGPPPRPRAEAPRSGSAARTARRRCTRRVDRRNGSSRRSPPPDTARRRGRSARPGACRLVENRGDVACVTARPARRAAPADGRAVERRPAALAGRERIELRARGGDQSPAPPRRRPASATVAIPNGTAPARRSAATSPRRGAGARRGRARRGRRPRHASAAAAPPRRRRSASRTRVMPRARPSRQASAGRAPRRTAGPSRRRRPRRTPASRARGGPAEQRRPRRRRRARTRTRAPPTRRRVVRQLVRVRPHPQAELAVDARGLGRRRAHQPSLLAPRARPSARATRTAGTAPAPARRTVARTPRAAHRARRPPPRLAARRRRRARARAAPRLTRRLPRRRPAFELLRCRAAPPGGEQPRGRREVGRAVDGHDDAHAPLRLARPGAASGSRA